MAPTLVDVCDTCGAVYKKDFPCPICERRKDMYLPKEKEPMKESKNQIMAPWVIVAITIICMITAFTVFKTFINVVHHPLERFKVTQVSVGVVQDEHGRYWEHEWGYVGQVYYLREGEIAGWTPVKPEYIWITIKEEQKWVHFNDYWTYTIEDDHGRRFTTGNYYTPLGKEGDRFLMKTDRIAGYVSWPIGRRERPSGRIHSPGCGDSGLLPIDSGSDI